MSIRDKVVKTLRLKEAPYAVTLLVAALGWSLTQAIGRLTEMPIIEYKLHDRIDHGTRLVTCEVTNICGKVFRNLNLYLTVEEGKPATISDPEIGFVKPIMPDPFQSRAAYTQGRNAAYFVPELQPFCSTLLEVRVDGAAALELRYYSGSETIRLIERSFQTWLVKNEIEIMIGLFAFWLFMLMLYVILVP